MMRTLTIAFILVSAFFTSTSFAIALTGESAQIAVFKEEFSGTFENPASNVVLNVAYDGTGAAGHTVTWDVSMDAGAVTISVDTGTPAVDALFTYPSGADAGQINLYTMWTTDGKDLQDLIDFINTLEGFTASVADYNGRLLSTPREIRNISGTATAVGTAHPFLGSLEVSINVPAEAKKTHRARGFSAFDTFGSGTGTLYIYSVDTPNDEATLLYRFPLTTATAKAFTMNEFLLDCGQNEDLTMKVVNSAVVQAATNYLQLEYSTLDR